MSLQEFIELLDGNWTEVAGSSARNQCVDLANAYLRSVLHQPIVEWTNAIDFSSKIDKTQFDWIENTPTGVPQEGDIVIWGGTAYGHIAIFLEGDANSFHSFDQNWPTGSFCHGQEHDYTNVKGWLRFKGEMPTTSQEEMNKLRIDRDNNHNDRMFLYQGIGCTGEFSRKVAEERLKTISNFEDQIRADEKAIKQAQSQAEELKLKLDEQKGLNTSLQQKFEEYVKGNDDTIEKFQIEIQKLTVNNEGLVKQVETLKKQVETTPSLPSEFLEKNKFIILGAIGVSIVLSTIVANLLK